MHLGDVIVDAEGEVQGDRVNIVARLQAYAEPGGIVVSQAMANEVLGKTAADFFDLGELRLRNISHPVHAFRLRMPSVSPWPAPNRSFASGDVSGPVDAMLIPSERAFWIRHPRGQWPEQFVGR